MCFNEKEITEFNFSSSRYGDGRNSYCKGCQSTYYKAYNAARKAAQPQLVSQSKTCRDCGLDKPIAQFGKRSVSPDKHNIYCKKCWNVRISIAQKKRRAAKKNEI